MYVHVLILLWIKTCYRNLSCNVFKITFPYFANGSCFNVTGPLANRKQAEYSKTALLDHLGLHRYVA